MQKLTEAHQQLVDSLKEGHLQDSAQMNLQHGNLIAQLNDTNLSNTRELQRDAEARAAKLLQENKQTVEALQHEHANELQKVRSEADATVSAMKQEQSRLQDSLAQLETKMKEERKNNTFSMSKSGDRLMSVVRSVQELANELENTSKTVTAGEYSVFSELRDNRKQEKILSLGERDENEESPADDSLLNANEETPEGDGLPDSDENVNSAESDVDRL